MASDQEIFLFDVRQPLDLMAYPELIPGAQRIPPKEVLDKPQLLLRDKDVVVYCTCPGDESSRTVLRRALLLGFSADQAPQRRVVGLESEGLRGEP